MSSFQKKIISDKLSTFHEIIRTFQNLKESIAPEGFQFKELDNSILYFNLDFDQETKYPKILESVKVDHDLHMQLQYIGMSLE